VAWKYVKIHTLVMSKIGLCVVESTFQKEWEKPLKHGDHMYLSSVGRSTNGDMITLEETDTPDDMLRKLHH